MRNKAVLLLACLALFGCDSNKENSSMSSFETLNKTVEKKLPSVTNTVSQTIEETDKVIESVAQKSEETQKPPANISKDIPQKPTPTAKEADGASKKTEDKTALSLDLVNGKKIFGKCIPCHGVKANLKALNNSQDISKWSGDKIAESLRGYKNGSYGGKMKASMVPIVKPLKEDDIRDVVAYIETLKN